MDSTETIDSRSIGLDQRDDMAILNAFIEGQERAIAAVRTAGPALARAATAIAERTGDHGRIIYVGAGSSGLIAALDAAELAGTFGWPEDRTIILLADGTELTPAMRGGGEDDAGRGRSDITALNLTPSDAVIAVAASGRTPYTVAAASAARQAGALTIGLASNRDAPLFRAVEIAVLLETGPEIIAGSTRMNAGTAQKAALNLISSLAMIRLGHIYDGMMVNLRIDNAKLRARALRTLMQIGGCDEGKAASALDRCSGRMKAAALVVRGVQPAEAERLLIASGGNLRTALARLN